MDRFGVVDVGVKAKKKSFTAHQNNNNNKQHTESPTKRSHPRSALPTTKEKLQVINLLKSLIPYTEQCEVIVNVRMSHCWVYT